MSASFSPDGNRVLTADSSHTAWVWNADGTGTAEVLGHDDEVQSASFSPDGSRVVTASADHTSRVWPMDRDMRSVYLEWLWLATAYCLSPAERAEILGEEDETAQRNLASCRDRVARARL